MRLGVSAVGKIGVLLVFLSLTNTRYSDYTTTGVSVLLLDVECNIFRSSCTLAVADYFFLVLYQLVLWLCQIMKTW